MKLLLADMLLGPATGRPAAGGPELAELLLLAKLLLTMMLLAELLLTVRLMVGLLLLLLRLLLLLQLLLLPLLLGSSTHVVCQSLLNHQAGGEFRYSCISIAAIGLISAAFPARLFSSKNSSFIQDFFSQNEAFLKASSFRSIFIEIFYVYNFKL